MFLDSCYLFYDQPMFLLGDVEFLLKNNITFLTCKPTSLVSTGLSSGMSASLSAFRGMWNISAEGTILSLRKAA